MNLDKKRYLCRPDAPAGERIEGRLGISRKTIKHIHIIEKRANPTACGDSDGMFPAGEKTRASQKVKTKKG